MASTPAIAPPALDSCHSSRPFKSKTCTATLACIGGWLGLHRFYLYGKSDLYGWLHVLGTLSGLTGLTGLMVSQRHLLPYGLLTLLGEISLLAGFLTTLVYGLRSDTRWDEQFNPQSSRTSRTRWTIVFPLIAALFIGAGVLMGSLAFCLQAYFEHEVVTSAPMSK
jgi:hypothetical protein